MPGVIPLLLDFLSAYRITRLVTADTILDGPRDALVKWSYLSSGSTHTARETAEAIDVDVDKPGGWSKVAQEDECAPKWASLVTCRFCAGFWCSVLVVIARRRFPRQWAPIAEALALSAGAALIAGLED